MSTIRKELEFPAPPEGWEIDRYGTPVPGEKYWSSVLKWLDHDPALTYSPCYLIARKKQSPAEWANAQPDLAALARMLPVDAHLVLCTGKNHYLDLGCNSILDVFTLHAEYVGRDAAHVVCRRSQWVDA